MKRLTLLLVTAVIMFGSGISLFGQGKYGADSAECIKYLSYYSEYYKQKNYKDALPNWRKAYKLCPPTASQNMLIHGTTLYRQLISQNKNNAILKESLVDTLMQIHDIRIQNYPKYAESALNNKGLDMINYMLQDDTKAVYDGMKEIISANKEKSKPQFFLVMFKASCDLYGTGVLTADDVLSDFSEAMSYANMLPASEMNDKIKTDIENLLATSNVASCDNLIALFTPRLQETPDDLELAKNIVRMLSATDNCTDNQLFMDAANTMHRLEPSHTSAYFLYKLYSGRADVDNAVKFMEEAIAFPESDNVQDADYYYELAVFCSKNSLYSKAFNYALKASELNSEIAGKSYMLIGTVWGSVVCKGNEIETRAPYWVAVDYLEKAKRTDPSLAADADKLIRQYSQYFPPTADAFMYNYNKGDSYTVSCNGMRAVTTVRTQD